MIIILSRNKRKENVIKMLIGLVGIKGSGKSFIAKVLRKYCDYSIYSIASPLKEIAKILGFTDEELWGNKKEVVNPLFNISARKFLQTFGTEICRDILPTYLPTMKDIWITLLQQRINRFIGYNLVIDDVRFEDEMKCILDNGGIIIRVVNDEVKRVDFHSSETQEFQTKYWITNSSDTTEIRLLEQIDSIIHSHCI